MGQTLSDATPRDNSNSTDLNYNLPSSSNNSNNISNNNPLKFHQIHGDNIRVISDGFVAKRVESFCKGIIFSSRPIKVNEKIYIKIKEVSNHWSGVLRFGFTTTDPLKFKDNLPKYACPDLTVKPGVWAKALTERFCYENCVIYCYYNARGEVFFGSTGGTEFQFMNDIDTKGNLWLLIDLYGNTTSVEIVNQQRVQEERNEVLERLRSLQLTEEEPIVTPTLVPVTSLGYVPLPFHSTKGRNVNLAIDRLIATRESTEYRQGYVFSERPLRINESLIIKVLQVDDLYEGSLCLGLTSCNPQTIEPNDLPDDSSALLDRPEYWVECRELPSLNVMQGDEIRCCIRPTGELVINKNGANEHVTMHVDQTQPLWAYMDIYGKTLSCCMFVKPYVPSTVTTPTTPTTPSVQFKITNQPIQIQPSNTGAAVLVVNLPSTSMDTSTTATNRKSPDTSDLSSNDCTICYEKQIDCVLYSCGHMCMCFQCAMKQWKGIGGGKCPICRQYIRDVIRTFKP